MAQDLEGWQKRRLILVGVVVADQPHHRRRWLETVRGRVDIQEEQGAQQVLHHSRRDQEARPRSMVKGQQVEMVEQLVGEGLPVPMAWVVEEVVVRRLVRNRAEAQALQGMF